MAIHLAAKHGHNEVLQKLVETGVDIDERNIVSKEHIVTVRCGVGLKAAQKLYLIFNAFQLSWFLLHFIWIMMREKKFTMNLCFASKPLFFQEITFYFTIIIRLTATCSILYG